MKIPTECPKCGSEKVRDNGTTHFDDGYADDRYYCGDCDNKWAVSR